MKTDKDKNVDSTSLGPGQGYKGVCFVSKPDDI